MIYVGIAVVPTTLYLYWAHPAWAWLYMVDPGDVPGLAVVPLLVVHGGILVVGWYLGARLLRSDRGQLVVYVTGGCAALLVALALVLRARLGAYGSYADYQAGSAAALLEVKLGYVLIAVALGYLVATGYTALELLRDSRRVRAR